MCCHGFNKGAPPVVPRGGGLSSPAVDRRAQKSHCAVLRLIVGSFVSLFERDIL
jgi:hypothetical protein